MGAGPWRIRSGYDLIIIPMVENNIKKGKSKIKFKSIFSLLTIILI